MSHCPPTFSELLTLNPLIPRGSLKGLRVPWNPGGLGWSSILGFPGESDLTEITVKSGSKKCNRFHLLDYQGSLSHQYPPDAMRPLGVYGTPGGLVGFGSTAQTKWGDSDVIFCQKMTKMTGVKMTSSDLLDIPGELMNQNPPDAMRPSGVYGTPGDIGIFPSTARTKWGDSDVILGSLPPVI